jgi:hypothetical protein
MALGGFSRAAKLGAGVVGFVVSLAGILLLAAHATAVVRSAGPLKYVTETATSASASVSLEALCPGNARVTGGGGGIAPGPQFQVLLSSIYPTNNDGDLISDDGYEAQARNETGNSRKRTATAICLRRGQSNLAYKFSSQSFGTGALGVGGSVLCDSPNRVVGGGTFLQPPTTEVQLNDSHPLDPGDHVYDAGWGYTANKEMTAAQRVFAVHAICLPPGVRKLRYVYESRVVLGNERSTLKARCPRKYHVTGGGVEGFANYLASVPFDGKDAGKAPDDGWKGTMQNFNSPEALLVHAICIK